MIHINIDTNVLYTDNEYMHLTKNMHAAYVFDLVNVDVHLISNQFRWIWEGSPGFRAVRVEPLSHWESWIPAANRGKWSQPW
jgi:hypothetical protein